MKLYHSPTSPFVRKVMIVLHETGQAGDVTLVAASGTPVDPGTMPVAQNPLGKIPVLTRPDGPPLHDSRVICRYLDARAGTALYPPEPRLWNTLTLEATADGILEAAILMVYELRARPGEKRFAPWVEGQWAKIARALDALESRWMEHLSGTRDIGVIATACALGYLDFRHSARDWRKGHAELAAWHAREAGRRIMKATEPPA